MSRHLSMIGLPAIRPPSSGGRASSSMLRRFGMAGRFEIFNGHRSFEIYREINDLVVVTEIVSASCP
jgi:hypothetical protein